MTRGLLVRLYRLTRHERQLLAAAWVCLVVARLGLALLPFRTLRRWAECGPWPASQDGVPDPERAAELVEAAARHHLLSTTCLTRALVLCRLLRRRGQDARLVVGCARPEGRFEAHAWVAYGSQAVAAAGPIDRFEMLLGGVSASCGGVEAQGAHTRGDSA
jgi:hypothetical protein